jgi:hypothetical protein
VNQAKFVALLVSVQSRDCTKTVEELKIPHMERIFRDITPEVTAAYNSLRRQVIDRFSGRRDLLSGEFSSRSIDSQLFLVDEFNSWVWDASLVSIVQTALRDKQIVGSVGEERYYWWKWAMAMRRCANERFRPIRPPPRRPLPEQLPLIEPANDEPEQLLPAEIANNA